MKTIVENRIRNNPSLYADIDRAVRLLEEEPGGLDERVKAEWSLIESPAGHSLLELKLADWTGSVQGRFEPEEFKNQDKVQVRLDRLWDDLLQMRSHEEIRRLHEMVAQLEDE